MKLVSLIIPCYNYGWLLPETLDSVLAQTYPHWECLIIDDGSTDNSRSVAERYVQRDARFRYLYQVNKGMSAARNAGVAAATGDYVQFLDADDLLAPRKLELQVAFLEAHPSVDLVYGDMRYFRHGTLTELSQSMDMLNKPWMSGEEGQGEVLINAIVEKNLMVVNAPLTRAELLRRVGPFAEDLRSVEDWEFWVRCAMAGAHFRYDPSPETWALVRVHAKSTSQNMRRMHDFEIQVRQRLGAKLEEMGAYQAVIINTLAMQQSRANLATHYLVRGSVWAGVKSFLGLAYTTGKYRYYLGSIAYWLKIRQRTKHT